MQKIEFLVQRRLGLAIDLHEIDRSGEHVEHSKHELGEPQIDGHAPLDSGMEHLHDNVLARAQLCAVHLAHGRSGEWRTLELREDFERAGAEFRLYAPGDERIRRRRHLVAQQLELLEILRRK